ncbi:MAG: helix-turn-helix transcriptional regulator [Ruminococcus sp.]|nr:helix-turn-helix transcriptional regulator [Ruminococcus sp.]
MSEFNPAEMGLRIQNQRKKLGYTQQYVYDKMNISQNHYSRIENGHSGLSFENLLKISEILNISTDYILTGNVNNTSCPDFVMEYSELTDNQKKFIIEQIKLIKKFNLK